MSFLDHIRSCNSFDLGHFRPFIVANHRVGWVRKDFMLRLCAFPDVFLVRDDMVGLHERLTGPDERSRAVNEVLARLAGAGGLEKLRGEDYVVATDFGAEPLMCMDRSAVAYFGVRAYGIHVNGFVRDGNQTWLWIGRRAKDKAVAPGKLDNMVAGGQPAGLSLHENLLKEAAEEADIGPDLAARAVPVGAVTYCMENGQGLKPDTLFCYDLELPMDFTPRNTDGEIEEFMRWPVERVAELVRNSCEFKFNVNLVIIDFLIRHGFLKPDDEPDYLALVAGLRGKL